MTMASATVHGLNAIVPTAPTWLPQLRSGLDSAESGGGGLRDWGTQVRARPPLGAPGPGEGEGLPIHAGSPRRLSWPGGEFGEQGGAFTGAAADAQRPADRLDTVLEADQAGA